MELEYAENSGEHVSRLFSKMGGAKILTESLTTNHLGLRRYKYRSKLLLILLK
jgi:hypothetical protein